MTNRQWPTTALLVLTIVGTTAIAGEQAAVDLSRIERKIAKEPNYQHSPQYCLVTFGPEAKQQLWVVLDANYEEVAESLGKVEGQLYVDRNFNGDLTDADEKIGVDRQRVGVPGFEPVELRVSSSKAALPLLFLVNSASEVYLAIGSDATGHYSCRPSLGKSADYAPILRVAAPLEIALTELRPLEDGRFDLLTAALGTSGQGIGSFVHWTCDAVPGDTNAKVVVEVVDQEAPSALAIDRRAMTLLQPFAGARRGHGPSFYGSLEIPLLGDSKALRLRLTLEPMRMGEKEVKASPTAYEVKRVGGKLTYTRLARD